ncbi:lysozyme inhibitor LprI family protein [Aliarcobacter vitoriensis]|uniref:Lysozyme inhibitor LprI-like N-terminal domain-containing protein n=1 Tax=Aliarcobacter vitoriensis TaxID=2011099 RepID=A0A366MRU4_9BACT|nr:lysozyme inhibitor LprI family protein [Aliarcobacter vitoriensis]RBQ28573.1 hypothetical protein CRU91_08670 [Aliarcobacter vitoriensis]
MLRILLPILFYNLLFGASFNCTKASSYVEKMICADAQLSELDSKMGTLYKEASKNTTNKKELLDKQRTWVKDRENCTNVYCIFLSTKNRISQLESLSSNNLVNIASNDKIPFDISIETAYNEAWEFNYPLITITALKDNLKLVNIKANKGKCKIEIEPSIYISNGMPVVENNSFPLKINEYDTLKARVSQECILLRIDISTDEYEWTLENKKDFFYFN